MKWPEWFEKKATKDIRSKIKSKVNKELRILLLASNAKAIGSKAHRDSLHHNAKKAYDEIERLQKTMMNLFRDSALLFIGDYRNSNTLETREELLEFAREHEHGADKLVQIGMDFQKLQWVLIGAQQKLSELTQVFPKPKNSQKIDWKARIVVEATDAIVSGGYSEEDASIIVGMMFEEADEKRPSATKIREFRKERAESLPK